VVLNPLFFSFLTFLHHVMQACICLFTPFTCAFLLHHPVTMTLSKREGGRKKSDTFSICACHPCAGAMLIFSVSFQFYRMRRR